MDQDGGTTDPQQPGHEDPDRPAASEPAEPAEDVEFAEEAEPAEETEPAEPSEPAESAEPAGPSEPSEPAASAAADRPRRMLVAGGIIAAVGVVAAIAITIGNGDDLTAPPDDGNDVGITLPVAETTVPPSATETPTTAGTTAAPTPVAPTTVAATTVAATTVASTTTAAGPTATAAGPTTTAAPGGPTTTPAPGPAGGGPSTVAPGGGVVSVGAIVPDIAASRRHLATPQQVQTTVDQLLANGGRHDVALPGIVATLCATVELSGPIEVSGRWEHDGDQFDETGMVLRSAPGFGDCIDNDGEPLEPGTYQFIATDSEGTDSAAGTFVVDAVRIDQQFVNNADAGVCAILVSPTAANFFEDYVFATPLPPGSAVVIPIADVRQDVRVSICPGSEPRTDDNFEFDPIPGEPQPLNP